MPDQDGARIDARALLSSPDRSALKSKAAQSSSLTPLRLQCAAVSVRSVLHPHEQQKLFCVSMGPFTKEDGPWEGSRGHAKKFF